MEGSLSKRLGNWFKNSQSPHGRFIIKPWITVVLKPTATGTSVRNVHTLWDRFTQNVAQQAGSNLCCSFTFSYFVDQDSHSKSTT